MKRIFAVVVINENNEELFTNECKNTKEVKNVIRELNNRYIYKVVKNNKLVKKLTSKRALEVINNNLF